MKIKDFIKEHKDELKLVGAVLTVGIGIGVLVIASKKLSKTIDTTYKSFETFDEAIEVFKKFVDMKKDAAIFYECDILTVIDL